jgi:2-iminoacetate synthase
MSFSRFVNDFDNKFFHEIINNTDKNLILNILSKDKINYIDFLHLLSKEAGNMLENLAVKAREITIKRFGKVINFYAPVYLSNECTNRCVYCGFNCDRDIGRKTMSFSEIKNEYKILKDTGFDYVLLLTGESPVNAGLPYINKAVMLAKDYFTFIGLEIYPMEVEEYKKLIESGASGLTIYQETYDISVYEKMHISGRKKDYKWRLDTPERAAIAGFRKIGMGALLGLSNFRYEAAMLGAHLNYLQKKFWKTEFTLGFPRINPPTKDFVIPARVTDRELVQMMCALRIYQQETGFTLTTREMPGLRDNLIDLCITQISAGSRTNPGGYSHNDGSGEQFTVNDSRNFAEMVKVVKQKGFDPVTKDWSNQFAGIRK